MIASACALLGAATFYLGFGVDAIWGLAWLAPAPLLWLAYGPASRWQVFAASFAAGAAGQIYLVQVYGGQLPTAMLASMFLGYALLFALAVLIARSLTRRLPPLLALFAFPALWTAIEYGNSLLSLNGSYGAFAYASMGFPASVQVASLFGLYAVTFAMCLFANALALLGRGAQKAGGLGLGLCAAALLFGFVRLAAPPGPSLPVAALADWDARQRETRSLSLDSGRALVTEYAAAVRAEADRGARLIVLPEAALAFEPDWREPLTQPLIELAQARGATLVIGSLGLKPWRNVALSFRPDGSVTDYDKRHLLPPGEDRFVPGHRAGLLGGGQAVAICKDLDFERTLRSDAREGPIRILAVPANDFGKDGWIHARMAILRGVEDGFAVVRSAFHGLETISDAQGRVLASARTDAPGLTAVRARVPLGPGATLYSSIGDVFAWLCVGGTLVLIALALRARPFRS